MKNGIKITHYYKAVLKGGHVRKANYIEFEVYIAAVNKKDAARICKTMPRAKKDHKDFIRELVEIPYEEYMESFDRYDPYLYCKNKQEQDIIMDEIADRIIPEEKEVVRKKNKVSKKKYANHYADRMLDWCWDDLEYAV